jgi:hypothetical protein
VPRTGDLDALNVAFRQRSTTVRTGVADGIVSSLHVEEGYFLASDCERSRLAGRHVLGLRACLKSRVRGHVIVGVMTISTDIDKLCDTDLTEAAWALIAPMLPAARPGGRQIRTSPKVSTATAAVAKEFKAFTKCSPKNIQQHVAGFYDR